LLDNPGLCSAMGAEGTYLAREKFSWQSVGSAFEAILNHSIADKV